jgi:hypothetical protein
MSRHVPAIMHGATVRLAAEPAAGAKSIPSNTTSAVARQTHLDEKGAGNFYTRACKKWIEYITPGGPARTTQQSA